MIWLPPFSRCSTAELGDTPLSKRPTVSRCLRRISAQNRPEQKKNFPRPTTTLPEPAFASPINLFGIYVRNGFDLLGEAGSASKTAAAPPFGAAAAPRQRPVAFEDLPTGPLLTPLLESKAKAKAKHADSARRGLVFHLEKKKRG